MYDALGRDERLRNVNTYVSTHRNIHVLFVRSHRHTHTHTLHFKLHKQAFSIMNLPHAAPSKSSIFDTDLINIGVYEKIAIAIITKYKCESSLV